MTVPTTEANGKERQPPSLAISLATVALGMMTTLVRAVMPLQFEVTPTLVMIETVLEVAICIAVVVLNKTALAEAFKTKFTRKDFSRVIIYWALLTVGDVVFSLALVLIGSLVGIDFVSMISDAPAAATEQVFRATFPIGLLITTCITAPIMEEVVFRKTMSDLVQNKVIFVIISALLFGFIHTASFLVFGITYYIFYGVLIAIVYLRTKDLRTVILVHALGNIFVNLMGFLSVLLVG